MTIRAQHESGSIIKAEVKDSCDVYFMRECGYRWIARLDDNWQPIVWFQAELQRKEMVTHD